MSREIILKTSRLRKDLTDDLALTIDIVFIPGEDKYYTVGSLRRKWDSDHLDEFKEKHQHNLDLETFVPTKICLYLCLNEPGLYNRLLMKGILPDFDMPVLTYDTLWDIFVPEDEMYSCSSSQDENEEEISQEWKENIAENIFDL